MHQSEQSLLPGTKQQTTIAVLGVDHTIAPIAVREALAFVPADAVDFLRRAKESGLIQGGVLLSTCNRMEITVESKLPAAELRSQLTRYLLEYKRLPQTQKKYFLFHDDDRAYEHLFRLVAGYESMVQGETQIVGQVKEALNVARTSGNVTNTLLRLYEKSLEVAKQIRAGHYVGAVNKSAGAAAVDLLLAKDGARALLEARHLIVGAGLMAATLVEALKQAGASDLTLYNRTRSRATDFATKYGMSTYYSEDELRTGIDAAAYIWVATSASTPIITASTLSEQKEVTLFDLGLPRNVDETVSDRDGVRLFCIDDLGRESVQNRVPEEALDCISRGMDEFKNWLEGLGIRDVYSIIRSETEELLMRELQKVEGTVDEATAKALTDYSHQLTKRVSSDIISRLRKLSEATNDPIYAHVVRELYTTA